MAWLRERAMPLTACFVFAVLAALYLASFPAYDAVIRAVGHVPFEWPFLDTEVVLSAVRCDRLGLDTYAANPCDALHRASVYPPTWLALDVFPVTEAWTAPAGLAICLAFLASLSLLPRPATWWGAGVLAAAAISSAVVFALERGNVDLVLFVMAAGAAALSLGRPGVRLAGYALALAAGLLKYYPMALCALALRERLPRFVAVAFACLAVTAGVVALLWTDFQRAFAVLPGGWGFRDVFGAKNFATGWTAMTGLPAAVRTALWLGMSGASLLLALRLALRPDTRSALAALSERERAFLMAGGLMMAGCFYVAENIEYRAVHLLLALPALVALAPAARRFRVATACALLVLWGMAWRHLVADPAAVQDGAPPGAFIAAWLAGEVLWWTLMTVLVSAVVALALDTPVARALLPSHVLPPALET